MKKIQYNPDKHSSFDIEWNLHKGCKEWWYSTSILFDENNNMYSCQYTLMNFGFGPINLNVAMVALTDYQDNHHYYLQTIPNRKEKVYIDDKQATVSNVASAVKNDKGIRISLKHKDFAIDLLANYGKGPIWHCDDGKLYMGIKEEKETTLYYSWTNMPTEASLNLKGKEIKLHGKTWFDKQGGPYSIANMNCHWEWFSLRFFNEEEAMLFTFPKSETPYIDGTYVNADGTYHRLNDYEIKSLKTIEHSGLKWSSLWSLKLNGKDYTIEPLHEGYINFAYFEELCYIKDSNNEVVGYAFAELLPGVLNKETLAKGGKSSLSMKNLFKRIEI